MAKKANKELERQAEDAVRLAYRFGTSLNDLVPKYGTDLVNKMCDKMEKENAVGTAKNPPVVAKAVETAAAPVVIASNGKTTATPADIEKMRKAILRNLTIPCKECHDFFAPKSEGKEQAMKEALAAGWMHRRGWLCPKCAAKLPPLKVVEEKGDRKVVEVGEFQVERSSALFPMLAVSDPCYDSHDGKDYEAKAGKWVGFVVTRVGKWFGGTPHERTVMLLAVHESLRDRPKAFISRQIPNGVKSREPIGKGVDSGQMAIFDASADFAEDLYDECCEKSDLGGIIGGKGVASDTCLGDGGYNGSVWRDEKGKAVAAAVQFWSLTGKTD